MIEMYCLTILEAAGWANWNKEQIFLSPVAFLLEAYLRGQEFGTAVKIAHRYPYYM